MPGKRLHVDLTGPSCVSPKKAQAGLDCPSAWVKEATVPATSLTPPDWHAGRRVLHHCMQRVLQHRLLSLSSLECMLMREGAQFCRLNRAAGARQDLQGCWKGCLGLKAAAQRLPKPAEQSLLPRLGRCVGKEEDHFTWEVMDGWNRGLMHCPAIFVLLLAFLVILSPNARSACLCVASVCCKQHILPRPLKPSHTIFSSV